jgi:hypothetical protein
MEWSIGDEVSDALQIQSAPERAENMEKPETLYTPKNEYVGKASRNMDAQLAALVIVLFLLLAGGWLWEKQNRAEALVGDLQRAAAQEVRSQAPPAHQTPMSLTGASQPAKSASTPTLQIESYQRLGNRIMASSSSAPKDGSQLTPIPI